MLKALVIVVRLIFGGWMLFFGLNFYFQFMPLPRTPVTEGVLLARQLFQILETTHLFDIAKVLEVICGALLLANRFSPLAVALLMPVSVVIFVADVLLIAQGAPLIAGWACLLLNLFLLFAYSAHFMPMLSYKADVSGLSGFGVWRRHWTPQQR